MAPEFWIMLFLAVLMLGGGLIFAYLYRRPVQEIVPSPAAPTTPPKTESKTPWPVRCLGYLVGIWAMIVVVTIIGYTLFFIGGAVFGASINKEVVPQEIPEPDNFTAEEIKRLFLHNTEGPLGGKNGEWKLLDKTNNEFFYDVRLHHGNPLLTGMPVAYAAKYEVEWRNQSWNGQEVPGVAAQLTDTYFRVDCSPFTVNKGDTQIRLGSNVDSSDRAWKFRLKVLDPGDKGVPDDGKIRLRLARKVGPDDEWPDNYLVDFGHVPTAVNGVPIIWLAMMEVVAESGEELSENVFLTHQMQIWYGQDITDTRPVLSSSCEVRAKDVSTDGILRIQIPKIAELGKPTVYVSLEIEP